MKESYKESFTNLVHGTTENKGNQIINSQNFIPSETGWCGFGVYFYDIRAKAYWSANRTCSIEKENTGNRYKPMLVFADVLNIKRRDVLDLRSLECLKKFVKFASDLLNNENATILSKAKGLHNLRAILLDYYCQENKIKLVVGHFRQENVREEINLLADEWELVVGIETIYCVKDNSIISNIRKDDGYENKI